jgi:hypothetical protein
VEGSIVAVISPLSQVEEMVLMREVVRRIREVEVVQGRRLIDEVMTVMRGF